ncbi:hypothetical protein TWF696_006116 [Orbilia brochopaga]|uniref:Uncharacterized protein n=1 Tax=Orbilia brochopaga TaxID=3140254 RepID=A0AAV9UVV5_9PEZI
MLTSSVDTRFGRTFWVDASNKETLDQSFRHIAHDSAALRDSVDSSPNSVVQWLSSTDFEWLIVLDNADGDPDMISKYLPHGRQGNVLITSRNPNLRLAPPEASREVGKMSETDAVLLLLDILKLKDTASEALKSKLRAIASEVGFLALGVDHAGAAIAAGISSIENYVSDLRRHPWNLLDHPSLKGTSNYDYTLYGAWSMALSTIKQRAADTRSPARESDEEIALQMFNQFAFLHYNSITDEIFRRAAERGHCVQFNQSKSQLLPRDPTGLPCQLLQLDEEGKWDPYVFQKGIQVLISLSFVKNDVARGDYSLHPLVHSWARTRLSRQERYVVSQSVRMLLATSISFEREKGDYLYHRSIIPHITSLRQYIPEQETLDAQSADTYDKFSLVYHENGYYKEAEKLGSRVIEARSSIFGAMNQSTLTSATRLGFNYRLMGELGKAGEILADVLEKKRASYGEDHPETLDSMVDQAVILSDEGRYSEAEEMFQYILRTRKAILGDEHPETLKTTLDLCIVFTAQHRYVEAETLGAPVVEKMADFHEESHPRTLLAMAALAVVYANSGQLKKAEKLKIRVLQLRIESQGNNHPATLMAKSNLAATYLKQHRWVDAEKLIIPVIETRKKILGEFHLETLRSMLLQVNSYIGQERWNDAEGICVQVVESRKQKLRERHPHMLWAMHKLAIIYNGQGRLEQAEALWKRVMEMQVEMYAEGKVNTERVQVMHDLAQNLKCQGKVDEAIALMAQAVELQKKNAGS